MPPELCTMFQYAPEFWKRVQNNPCIYKTNKMKMWYLYFYECPWTIDFKSTCPMNYYFCFNSLPNFLKDRAASSHKINNSWSIYEITLVQGVFWTTFHTLGGEMNPCQNSRACWNKAQSSRAFIELIQR